MESKESILIAEREGQHANSLIGFYYLLSFVNSLLFSGTLIRSHSVDIYSVSLVGAALVANHILFYIIEKTHLINFRKGILLNSISVSIIMSMTIFHLQSVDFLNIGFFNFLAILFMALQEFSVKALIQSLFFIYTPYFIACSLISDYSFSRSYLDLFFVFGTIFIFYFVLREKFRELGRVVNEQLEFESQITNRDKEISERSVEEANLKTLSCQFSPQIIRQIKSNQLSLESGTHIKEICYIFVDIVGSTQRTNSLPPEDLQKVTNMFMEDAIKTLLFYDLTIDKFKGDAVSAFANDPIEYDNYVDRTCIAALALRSKIAKKKAEYKKLWGKEFYITIGIASGPCEIGFFGHNNFFKTYSAKGEAPQLAEEMTNLAGPDQIIIDSDVFDACRDSNLITRFNTKAVIPSFKDYIAYTYELLDAEKDELPELEETRCPSCGEAGLYLVFEQGIGLLQCRSCLQVIMDLGCLDEKTG
ncbi:adenylate/guanylate cyclase domain-containing protein [Bdellovibrionales bacterium]|nr:adenylate/guanylate cyclase domain-containing protein [Bdellovibrionales bacterium]